MTTQTAEAVVPTRRRAIAVVVGILFVVQMVTAIIGTSLIQAFVDGDAHAAPTAGVLLMMFSGIAVVGIGLLMYRVLREVNQRLAFWYPVLRIVEFTVSAACGVYLLNQLQVVPNQFLWVYISDRHRRLRYQLPPFRLPGWCPGPSPCSAWSVRPVLAGSPPGPGVQASWIPNQGLGMLVLAPGFLFEFVVPADLVDRQGICSVTVGEAGGLARSLALTDVTSGSATTNQTPHPQPKENHHVRVGDEP